MQTKLLISALGAIKDKHRATLGVEDIKVIDAAIHSLERCLELEQLGTSKPKFDYETIGLLLEVAKLLMEFMDFDIHDILK